MIVRKHPYVSVSMSIASSIVWWCSLSSVIHHASSFLSPSSITTITTTPFFHHQHHRYRCHRWKCVSQHHNQKDPQTNNNENQSGNILIFGNGNVAKAVLSCLLQQSLSNATPPPPSSSSSNKSNQRKIFCTYRTSPPTHPLTGVQYIPFHSNATLHALQHSSHVLITIPPIMNDPDDHNDDDGNPSKRTYMDPILDHPNPKLISSILSSKAWIGYVSTTGVYGNHNGEWVDEDESSSPLLCAPNSKAFAYLDIERRWQHMDVNVDVGMDEYKEEHGEGKSRRRNVCIFRCAGLYGDDFSALHTVRKKGYQESSESSSSSKPVEVEVEGISKSTSNSKQKSILTYTSRVHLVDVARAIVACMGMNLDQQPSSGVFNLADSMPAPRQEVMHYAYQLLQQSNVDVGVGIGVGVGVDLGASAGAGATPNTNTSERRRRRKKDRKRVRNTKMMDVLGNLSFPTYREGLEDVLANNLNEWKGTGTGTGPVDPST